MSSSSSATSQSGNAKIEAANKASPELTEMLNLMAEQQNNHLSKAKSRKAQLKHAEDKLKESEKANTEKDGMIAELKSSHAKSLEDKEAECADSLVTGKHALQAQLEEEKRRCDMLQVQMRRLFHEIASLRADKALLMAGIMRSESEADERPLSRSTIPVPGDQMEMTAQMLSDDKAELTTPMLADDQAKMTTPGRDLPNAPDPA
ncbi:hypothetical protein J1614_000782 [Plenodomus biglobosus]|nr:hypothetical protein J1614_000782 [Plenodomus biglobosus]